MNGPGRLREAARRLKREVRVLLVLRHDPRVPLVARLVVVLTAAYALSPVDLIPDVVPVLGLLDDLLIVPAGVWLALRLAPPDALADARRRVADEEDAAALGWLGVGLVVALWAVALALVWAGWRRIAP